MKILFVTTRGDEIGGPHIHIRDLANTLTQQEHKVLVVTGASGAYNTVLERCKIQSVSCNTLQRRINPIQDCLTLPFLIRTIHQFQPDIVSTHTSKAGILGRLASRFTNTPCIHTAHGWAFLEGMPEPNRTIYQILERLTEPLADKIICVSEHTRKVGLRVGMSPNRLLTIYNGMPDVPDELRAKPDIFGPVHLVMVARFDRPKDHLTLLKACQNFSGIQLDLVGDGPKLEEIKTVAYQMRLADRVNFLGYCENVAEILAQAHIFVLISDWEGFPRAIIEAMRAGLPVAATNVGGVAEAVADGITGYCVPRSDVDSLRERLSRLVSDTQLRCEMGYRGRQRYESEFTFKCMFDRTFEVYKKLSGKNFLL